ncbi:MAG TPA: ribonuclease HII [Candidatus Saccharimonadales bacterium]|nr:ribonuclease HII [Candidatus Saccharimonadales bacterium]
MQKVAATFNFEKPHWNDKKLVVGIDEVGRGAWAGPLVAAAVILPINFHPRFKLYDSKLIDSVERKRLSKLISKHAVSFGIGWSEVSEIENLGLTAANLLAYQRALEQLTSPPDHYLIDAFKIPSIDISLQTPIIHGDRLSASIAAASIVAKVYRDELMIELNDSYPEYSLNRHKGYGTKLHQEAILKFGLTDIHRATYDLAILHD